MRGRVEGMYDPGVQTLSSHGPSIIHYKKRSAPEDEMLLKGLFPVKGVLGCGGSEKAPDLSAMDAYYHSIGKAPTLHLNMHDPEGRGRLEKVRDDVVELGPRRRVGPRP